MRGHPLLNVNDITPDPELVGQLPPAVALYYLALPLAREDGQVSVALAHPENTTALAMISRLLGGAVVPVRSAAAAIRGVLQTLQPATPATPVPAILGWSPDPAWTPAISAWTQLLAAAMGSGATLREAAQIAPDEGLALAAAEQYRLMVLGLYPDASPADLLCRATGPLLLLRDPAIGGLQRILVALRGFSSDAYTLEWAMALAQHTGAAVTLLPLFASPSGRLEPQMTGDSRMHLLGADGLGRYQAGGTLTHLKLRQGGPVQQIADEYEQGNYDLLVLAAEGVGEFVGRVLAETDRRPGRGHGPVLVVKPSYA